MITSHTSPFSIYFLWRIFWAGWLLFSLHSFALYRLVFSGPPLPTGHRQEGPTSSENIKIFSGSQLQGYWFEPALSGNSGGWNVQTICQCLTTVVWKNLPWSSICLEIQICWLTPDYSALQELQAIINKITIQTDSSLEEHEEWYRWRVLFKPHNSTISKLYSAVRYFGLFKAIFFSVLFLWFSSYLTKFFFPVLAFWFRFFYKKDKADCIFRAVLHLIKMQMYWQMHFL